MNTNFVDDVYAGKYENNDNFNPDFHDWLLENKVPEKYVSKIAYQAWVQGHSSGLTEVVNCAFSYIELFAE